jgi:predicted alpha/beta-fold hydrolase
MNRKSATLFNVHADSLGGGCDRPDPVGILAAQPAEQPSTPWTGSGADHQGAVMDPMVGAGKRWVAPLPGFRPIPGLRAAHLQTILGPYLAAPKLPNTVAHRIPLADGDCLTVHEDGPLKTGPADTNDRPLIVVSIHGLAGCHRSSYVRRLAWGAIGRGWFSYRMDMRGAGDSGLQSRFLYHAGRSDDLRTALQFVRQQHPRGRIYVCGFSLGGSITLHLLANLAGGPQQLLEGAVAVCPPLDLQACSENLGRGWNRIYDRTFARSLWKSLRQRPNAVRELGQRMPPRPPRSLVEFDSCVTAPLGGYPSASHYYQKFSTIDQVQRIDIPTLVLFSQDDPLIPFRIAQSTRWSPATMMTATAQGGHLGFIGTSTTAPRFDSLRWLENAVLSGIAQQAAQAEVREVADGRVTSG